MKKYNTEQRDLPNEQWRDLIYPETKGIYYISNFGRYKRKWKYGFYYSLGAKAPGGYYQLDIRVNNKQIAVKKMHILVFEAFYRRLQPNEVVHHLSEVKTQNQKTNLVGWDEIYHLRFHNTGKTASLQTRQKRSKSLKGIKRSAQWKRKLSESCKGRTRSEQQKKKISEGMKRVWQSRKRINNNEFLQEN